MHLSAPKLRLLVRSKAVVLLLLIYCLMYFCLWGFWVYLVLVTLLCISFDSFGNHLEEKKKLVALLLLFDGYLVTVNVLLLFLTVQWVGLQCVIVVFPDHTHYFWIGSISGPTFCVHAVCK